MVYLAGEEPEEIAGHDLRMVRRHLAGPAREMGRQGDLVQADQGVIGRQRLAVEDVQRRTRDPARLQGLDQCSLVHEIGARC